MPVNVKTHASNEANGQLPQQRRKSKFELKKNHSDEILNELKLTIFFVFHLDRCPLFSFNVKIIINKTQKRTKKKFH